MRGSRRHIAAFIKSSVPQFFDVTAQIDDEVNTFTIPKYRTGTLKVFWNGISQRLTVEITEVNSTSFRTQFVPQSGDVLHVYYSPL